MPQLWHNWPLSKNVQTPQNLNFRGTGKSSNRGGMRRKKLVDQATDQSALSSKLDGENVVLQLNGTGVSPVEIKERINKQPFSVTIESGSPITIFTRGDLRRLLRSDLIFVRPLPKKKEYVN